MWRWSWVACAFGVGRIPWAPGAWGSVVGLLLGLAGLRWAGPALTLAALAPAWWLAALICTRAERELGRHDPSVVVLDEVCGMATVVVCLPWLPWMHRLAAASGRAGWLPVIAGFVLFRIFDVVKPPPLRHLARLPAGWGIAMDDLGAAIYALGVLALVQ